MTKKLTISVDDQFYEQLYAKIGPRKIGKFLQEIARPYLLDESVISGYKAMAQDQEREQEASDWCESLTLIDS